MIFLDVEADGLLNSWENEDNLPVSKVHCVGALREDQVAIFLEQKYLSLWPGAFPMEMLPMALTDTVVGHNLIRYDIPVLDKILGVKIEQPLIDTLLASKLLYPDRSTYSLESFGELTGQLKTNYKPVWRDVEVNKEMIEYLIDDLHCTKALYERLVKDGLEEIL